MPEQARHDGLIRAFLSWHGTAPKANCSDKATFDSRWNVVALSVGVEKSIQRQDDYGKDWQVELNIIPVIPSLVKNPLFENSNSGTD